MSIISMALVKGHLRVDDDGAEDDLLAAYLAAAEEGATEYLGRRVYATQGEVDSAIASGEDRPMLANPSFTAAVLYMVAAMYHKREDATNGANQFPQESRRLLDPFRIGQGV